MRSEELVRRCDDHLAAHPIAAEMTFADGLLMLGAGTRLAKFDAPLDEPRLAALLTSAHGGPIEASRLTHVRRAVEIWRNGDRALALTHLALSRLAKLGDPLEGVRRLFFADALMDAGVTPDVIVAALTNETASAGAPAVKYSPDQSRVPAGSPDGGQWTREAIGPLEAPMADRPKSRSAALQIALVLPDGCEQESARAREICSALLMAPNPPRGQTGGNSDIDNCARGFVSERCGGNPVRRSK
ncbi:MAG: hypothetical protein ABSF67_03675 [Roseiarcus sp.]|jgi:hypothetical protein